MTKPKCSRQYGQHRRRLGQISLRHVADLWQFLHPDVEVPDEIQNLGLRNYTPRHALGGTKRQRVYL